MKQEKVNLPATANLNDLSRFTAQVSSLLVSLCHQDSTMIFENLWDTSDSVDSFLSQFRDALVGFLNHLNFSPFDVQRVLMSYSEIFPDKIEVSTTGDEELEKVAKQAFDQIVNEKHQQQGKRYAELKA